MARRHESLIPLSKDHYQGLLLAQQIKTNDRIMLVGWPSDPKVQAQFVAGFYKEHLVSHFEAEEKSLFPLIAKHIPAARGRIDELVLEHRRMEEFAGRFAGPDADIAKEELTKFSELLEAHIRKEERELFPLFESKAPPEVLEQAKDLLHRHYPNQLPTDR